MKITIIFTDAKIQRHLLNEDTNSDSDIAFAEDQHELMQTKSLSNKYSTNINSFFSNIKKLVLEL